MRPSRATRTTAPTIRCAATASSRTASTRRASSTSAADVTEAAVADEADGAEDEHAPARTHRSAPARARRARIIADPFCNERYGYERLDADRQAIILVNAMKKPTTPPSAAPRRGRPRS